MRSEKGKKGTLKADPLTFTSNSDHLTSPHFTSPPAHFRFQRSTVPAKLISMPPTYLLALVAAIQKRNQLWARYKGDGTDERANGCVLMKPQRSVIPRIMVVGVN